MLNGMYQIFSQAAFKGIHYWSTFKRSRCFSLGNRFEGIYI